MIKSRIFVFTTMALGITLFAANALAQGKNVKEQITGTWSLISYEGIAPDGAKKPIFGANPTGTLILNANGRYAMIIVDSNRLKNGRRNHGKVRRLKNLHLRHAAWWPSLVSGLSMNQARC